MAIKDIFNSIGSGVKKVGNSLSHILDGAPVTYVRPSDPVYKIPPVIPKEHHKLFIEQAKLAGVHPDEFGQIAAREQGSSTKSSMAKLIGQVDSTDRGVMQVNKINEPMIQQRFKKELGRNYNPNNAVDSIIGARMVLEENRKQFEQKKTNQTYTNPYSSQNLIDTYNTGVNGFIKAQQGDKEKQNRLLRYQNAGQ